MPHRLAGSLIVLAAMTLSAQTKMVGRVEGVVIDVYTNQPIAKARVKLTPTNLDPLYTFSDEQGHFSFATLPALGGFRLQAERPGYSTVWENGRNVVVTGRDPAKEDASRPPNVIHLFAYATISGRVTDANGAPVAQSTVTVFRRRPGSNQRAVPEPNTGGTDQTNDLGEYRIPYLIPGTYYIQASQGFLSPKSTDHMTYFPAALNESDAGGLQVSEGQQASADIQILRIAGVRVSGQIVQPATPPAAGMVHDQWIQLRRVDEAETRGQSDVRSIQVTNKFEFENITPGRYFVIATTEERPEASRALEDRRPVFGVQQEITIPSHDVAGLQVELQPLPAIEGKLVSAEGCTPRGKIYVQNATVGTSVDNASDGSFVLNKIYPGRVRLQVHAFKAPMFDAGKMRLNNVELKDGEFDYPVPAGAKLEIEVTCRARN